MNKKPRFSQPLKKQTLAEQVAEAIKESILAGEWQGGDALPTEPELSQQFGVSRAVIRDATRMLVAHGLVEAQHGRGVFVTNSQAEAFGDALLLALRRAEASVWDVEQFEQLLFPEVAALAAREATDDEISNMRQLAEAYLLLYEQLLRAKGVDAALSEYEKQQLLIANRRIFQAIFAATHNKLLSLLAKPLARLRNLRYWEGADDEFTEDEAIAVEQHYLLTIVDTIATRDPDQVRAVVADMMQLPPAAETAMRQTPVGEMPHLPGHPLL